MGSAGMAGAEKPSSPWSLPVGTRVSPANRTWADNPHHFLLDGQSVGYETRQCWWAICHINRGSRRGGLLEVEMINSQIEKLRKKKCRKR